MSVPNAQSVTLLKVTVVEGFGKDEDDPVRNVDYYYLPSSGVLLFRWDEWEEEKRAKNQSLADNSRACMHCGAPVDEDRVWQDREGP